MIEDTVHHTTSDILPIEEIKKLNEEFNKKLIPHEVHEGIEQELKLLKRIIEVERKLDMILKHFNIVPIIGAANHA